MSSVSATTVHSASSAGYTNATNYQSIRPSYPAEVANYVLQHTLLSPDHPYRASTRQRILDVGAGTGKWTAALDAALKRHRIDCDLQAADPVPAMAATFAQQLPHIPVHTAPASELPFDDAQFDLLTAATAFHWFCDDASVRSLHRVLKQGACFAVLGYDLTVAHDWTAPMQALLDSYYPPSTPYPRHGHWRRALAKATQAGLLQPIAHTVFEGAAVLRTDRAGFVRRFCSASAIGALEGVDRDRCVEAFNRIVDSDERFVGKSEFVMMDDVEVTILRKVH